MAKRSNPGIPGGYYDTADAIENSESVESDGTSESEVLIEDAEEIDVFGDAEEVDVFGDAEEIDVIDDAEEIDVINDAEAGDVIYKAESGGVIVEVTAPAGALPEGAELVVERFTKDSDEYKEAAEAIDYEDDEASGMAAMDISFYLDGEEVEPSETVKVSIDVSEILPEEADASTIEVQHLIEIETGAKDEEPEIEAVVVANDSDYIEGTIDGENAVAEFEVSSFSTFTVTWDESTGSTEDDMTITVHVYNINGTSIDEELDEYEYSSVDGVIYISDLITHLHQNSEYDSTYTFQYATVLYETSNGGGYNLTTIGSEEDSVTSISKNGTSYTVIYGNETSVTVDNPYLITIHLYYSIPTVTINTENPHEDTVLFTTTSAYFQGEASDATYNWSLTDDSLGTITPGENGTASFAWDTSVAQIGDQVTVMVTMTVGEETASDTYTLTYGDESIDFTVYAEDGTTPQSNAHVALVDASGNTVATGITDENGTVTLYAPAGEYTVGVTYVYQIRQDQSTSRATAETTITVSEDGTVTGSATLGTAVVSGPNGDTNGSSGGGGDPYYYEHIDVKVVVADTESESADFTDLDAVYVYDKYGNLIYWNDDLIENADTTDYNCKFDMGNAEDTHSIVVSSEDTIVLVYEVYEDGEFKTNTIRVNASSLYPDGEYYSYTSVNAWQLCNCIYGTNISKTDWEAAVAEGDEAVEALFRSALGDKYNDYGISITGLSYIQAADYLCDTREQPGQAGLDITFEVGGISVLNQEYDIQIAKSLRNVPEDFDEEDLETFYFTLTELKSVVSDESGSDMVWSAAYDNVVSTSTGSTQTWTKEGDGSWSSIIDFDDFIEYEAEENTVYYYYILGEDDANTAKADVQYYGIKVAISFSSATGLADVTASYCELTKSDENSNDYVRTGGWSGFTASTADDGSIYYSIPFANYYDDTPTIDISGSKTWVGDSESDRPESVKIYLYADEELVTDEEGNAVTAVATADDGWTWSFTDLPKYQEDGETEIVYTVQEEYVSGYVPSYTYGEDESITITNAIPEVHKYVSDPAFGESTDDLLHEDEADNSDTLEYRLEADHVGGAHNLVLHDLLDDQLDIDTLSVKSVTLYTGKGDEGTVLTEGTDYTVTTGGCSAECGLEGCSFEIHVIDEDVEGLSADAYIIVIFDIEAEEGAGDFNESYVDEIDNWAGLSYTVYNALTGEEEPGYAPPDKTETYSYGFDLYKYDAESEEPLEGAEFVLSKDGDAGAVYALFDVSDDTYMLIGWTDSIDGATPIVTGSDGKAVVEGLHDGTFSIEETKAPEGYQQKTGTITVTITVSDDPENPTITATNADVDGMEVQIENTMGETTEVIGSKTWVGDDENDRPDSITIYLYADGTQIDSVTVTADDDWAWSFSDLPVYQSDGETEIIYTILEGGVSGYIPTYSEDGLNVTNAIPEVHKYVSDPAFGESTDDLLHEDEADNSDTLEYRLEADHVGGMHSLVLHDLLDDQLDIDTLSVKSVTLYTGKGDEGTVLTEGTDYTVTTGGCSAECGLEGCSFEIHVIDEDVEGLSADAYIIVIFDIEAEEGAGDFNESYVDEIDNWAGLSYTVYNALTGEEEPGYAPPDKTETYSYGFDLYKYDADSEEPLEGAEFVLSKDGDAGAVYAVFDVSDDSYMLSGWTGSRDGATPIVTGSDGKAVVEGLHDGTFSIEETKAPEGYSQISETITVTITVSEDPESPTITATNAIVSDLEVQIGNTPISEDMININGSKTWNDSSDSFGSRPDSITIRLLADGVEVDSATVTADDGWAWSFTDMPKYQEDGTTEINYTITEDAVNNYDTTYDGYNVINTFSPGSTSVSVLKLWDDDNDADGIRPDSITVVLEKNGEATDTTLTLSADNNWEGSFTGLAIYDQEADGSYSSTRNVYTVQEVSVEGYTTEILGDASSVYIIINTPAPDIETEPGPVVENPGSGTPDTQTEPGPVVENPDTGNPVPTAKTSDPGLPILPLAGCCAAIALIAAALVIRRRRAD